MPIAATRTTNPLPFQDLEPKRFEDLVRQLTYDFRSWRRLEATGRSGADNGFDARGLEIVNLDTEFPQVEKPTDDCGEDATVSIPQPDRLWLIQCKRERSIGPTKAVHYLNEIFLAPNEPLHGLIFAAACDFSKRTRDAIDAWCRDHGITEAHVWGRGELEDMLFQPKNDNLLFAYFGLSLTIRRRSQTAQLRTELAAKQKLARTVMKSSAEILLRDPIADEYPDCEPGKHPTRWGVYQPEQLTHLGLMLKFKWHFAYVDLETGAWDAADAVSAMEGHHPWRVESEEQDALLVQARNAWSKLPDRNQGWLKLSGFVPYRNILAVDDLGDEVFKGTHVYVPFYPKHGPFESGGYWPRLTTTSAYSNDISPDPEKRVQKFPYEIRKAKSISR